jgi:ABC-type transport system involved in multi-copper enzyme maturation permease subunit
MKSPVWILFKAEFKRRWGLIPIIGIFVIGAMAAISFILMSIIPRGPIDIVKSLQFLLFVFSVPLIVIFFGTDLIAADIYDGWLRSILLQPVKRHHYLSARLFSSLGFTAVGITIAVLSVLATIPFQHKLYAPFDTEEFVVVCIGALGQAYVYLSILATLSCWLKGFMNVAVLVGWWIGGGLLYQYVSSKYWDSAVLTIAKEFIFPSGFVDAVSAFSVDYFPVSEFLWGIANATGWLAVAYWSMNKIQIDRSFE